MALLFTVLLGITGGIFTIFAWRFIKAGPMHDPAMAWLAGIGLLCVICVIATGFAISAFVVSRTGQIAATARSIIETGDLSQRIAVDSRWDDLGYMADTLNQLLARIETLVHGVKQVSDNIAHDLRTPLTRMRNRLETLQADAAIAARPETAALCDDLLREADHLLATFAALLRIARIEAGRQRSQFAPTRLDAVLRDVLDLYEPLAEERSIVVTAQFDTATIQGDRDLLFQAFANLIDNAIKFTPAGGAIGLVLDGRSFSITDTGPGIPGADHDRIFERFYRTDASRNMPGNGLGLSLVAAVAGLHDAHITVSSANPGLRIGMRF